MTSSLVKMDIVNSDEVSDPALPTERYQRYELFPSDAYGMDAAGMDTLLMSFEQWHQHWRCNEAGDLVTV